ncbi:MAG TPA: hypothetical protein VHM02_09625, partial [Thermoanaerobaculia bacterium]|nr:hypothetical protein [Thermoanaerobaculia bacterium]
MTHRVTRVGSLLAAVALAVAAGCGGGGRLSEEERAELDAAFAEEVAAAIEQAVGAVEADGDEWQAVAAFYEERGYRPAWLGATGPTARGRELAVEMLGAGTHGLDVTDYAGERLALAVAELTRPEAREDEEAYAERVARLDPALSAAFLHLAHDLATGRVAPTEAEIHWESEPRRIDLGKVLAAAAEQGPATALAAARPPHEQYALLERALAGYRRAVAAGGWPEVPPGEA